MAMLTSAAANPISNEMRKAPDGASLLRLEQRFWERAVEGAHNLAYRLAYNTLIKSAQALGEMAERWAARELEAAGRFERVRNAAARTERIERGT